jgi:hypothetical protein
MIFGVNYVRRMNGGWASAIVLRGGVRRCTR